METLIGTADPNFIAGTGEMAQRLRAFNWQRHPLGPPENWPQSLKIVIRIMLTSRYAMWLGWGTEFYFFCNDAYLPTVGLKRDWVLGASARKVWAEIWPEIGPRAESVVKTGEATWDEALQLFLQRSGYTEETYHTFSYSPVPNDDGSIGGMLCVVTEDTDRVIGERRMASLRDIAAELDNTRQEQALFETIGKMMARHPKDLPFGMIYLFDEEMRSARLACAYPATPGSPIAPLQIPLANEQTAWPVRPSTSKTTPIVVQDLAARFAHVPSAAWDRPPKEAAIVPLTQQGQEKPAGFFIVGLNPYRRFDTPYQGFIELLAGQIAAALANVRAYEQERKRAEALAELDRAKTAFFSNISHEFRTPLTLMLGPIEEELRHSGPGRENLELAHRSSLRLLKLVNTLLDFSRIEAGRMEACYEPTNLAAYTADLVSVFQSAVEKAGLALLIDCPTLPEPVYVDHEMWEKIVLNLVSNAFKFTLEGQIKVSLRQHDHRVDLIVTDTGVGIPASELPKVFDRFHRVRGTRSRSHEGTGIGLALVQELVALHGGEIKAESLENKGTTFTVSLPCGCSHLPPDRVGTDRRQVSTEPGSASFVEEVLSWLPDQREESGAQPPQTAVASNTPIEPPGVARPRILLADDNADMRNYVWRLLAETYQVEAVADGEAALKAIQTNPPDLILTDVMMPGLDGFGLLQQIRTNERTRSIPVIMLSARAGEEARVDGLDSGADEYLTKPFGARELLARVRSQLDMARLRREALTREQALRQEIQLHAQHLEKTVARRTSKLRETVADLEQFSYAITHDMRAPLRAMQGFASMLEEETLEDQNPLAQEYSKRIRAASVRLDQLITDSLNYSKVVRQELTIGPVDLNELIAGLIETYPNLQPDQADIELQPDLPVVLGNEAALTQCFSNLLGNAVKFTQPGIKPKVRVRPEPAWRSTDSEHHHFIRIWVEDEGIGIPKAFQERIFFLF